MKVLVAAETNGSSLKLMKQKQNFKDLLLFSDIEAVVNGQEYDELTHEVRSAPSTQADIVVGCF